MGRSSAHAIGVNAAAATDDVARQQERCGYLRSQQDHLPAAAAAAAHLPRASNAAAAPTTTSMSVRSNGRKHLLCPCVCVCVCDIDARRKLKSCAKQQVASTRIMRASQRLSSSLVSDTCTGEMLLLETIDLSFGQHKARVDRVKSSARQSSDGPNEETERYMINILLKEVNLFLSSLDCCCCCCCCSRFSGCCDRTSRCFVRLFSARFAIQIARRAYKYELERFQEPIN